MTLTFIKSIRLPFPSIDVAYLENRLYIATKSNKLIECDTNLSNKKSISFKSNITRLANDGDILICISKHNIIYKYNTVTMKCQQTNIKYEISFIKKLDIKNKYLVGCKDGKVFYSNNEMKPIRFFYGCIGKVLDCCSTKDKMVVVGNKLVITDLKTSKVKNTNLGFINCLHLFNKKFVILGGDKEAFLYDTEKDKIINKINLSSPVSYIKIFKDTIFIGCESGLLYELQLVYNEFKIKNEIKLQGVINFLEIINNFIFIGTGREEREGSFCRNKKYKNVLYKFKID